MRVLIVDDIFTNRLLLSEYLETLEIPYDEAENGKQAIEALELKGYELVLMDIEMPVMNGIETTRYIRTQMKWPLNNTFVVALTAHDPNLFFEDYKGAGFNELLTKPYSLEKITTLIEKVRELTKG
jgi:CheY-like chemotaxis protein